MNYNPQTGYPNITSGQTSSIYPYGMNSNLVTNLPYQNYLGKGIPIQSNQFLKCRPVSSKEEAIAYQIDLDGSLWVFTDIGNGKIYTKQINNDGTATFKIFEEKTQTVNSVEYVTKEELNQAIQNLIATLSIEGGDKTVIRKVQK